MRQILQMEDISVTCGCASRLNILDNNATTDSVMVNVKIQNFFFFRNHHTPRSLLKEYADSVNHKFHIKQDGTLTCLKSLLTGLFIFKLWIIPKMKFITFSI